MGYSVYKHTFPNGKVYIGMTGQEPEKRWANGWGYITRPEGSRNYNKVSRIGKAIVKYGWNNIKHEIVYSNLTKEEANKKEEELIVKYKSDNDEFGYNYTKGGRNLLSEERKKELFEKSIECKGISVMCVETGECYESFSSAARAKNLKSDAISRCCRGMQQTTGGFHWDYVFESDREHAKWFAEYRSQICSLGIPYAQDCQTIQ